MRRILAERLDFVDLVQREVEDRGPMTAREVEVALSHDQPRARTTGGGTGARSSRHSSTSSGPAGSAPPGERQFERRYASLERTAPPRLSAAWRDRPGPEADADRFVELVRIAARAHGIGTELCLADYFRIKRADARVAITQLETEGELIPVEVPGWRPAWLHAGARVPRRVHAEALLSPFDSLVWQRDRVHALWDFHYRLEIYTPAHKRVHGVLRPALPLRRRARGTMRPQGGPRGRSPALPCRHLGA